MKPHNITLEMIDAPTLAYLELVAQKKGQEALDAWMTWVGWREVSNYKKRSKAAVLEDKSKPGTKKSIDVGSSGQIVRIQMPAEWRLARAKYLALTLQIAKEKATRAPQIRVAPKDEPTEPKKRKKKAWQIKKDPIQ